MSTTDGAGGAGRAARRLHDGLGRVGVRSRMVAAHVSVGGDGVQRITAAPGRPASAILSVERVVPKLSRFTGEVALPYPSSWLLERSRLFAWADVIHLHNLHGTYFDHRVLRRWARLRPLVWTLHDMWPISGHCAYSFGCERWRTGCGPCPLFEPSMRRLDDIPQPPWDNSRSGWRRKRRLYADASFAVTAPSRWLLDLARQSLLAANPATSFHHVPYGLDTEVFRPLSKPAARERLGLPPEGPVAVFAAAAVGQERKGIRHLAAALRGPELAGRDLTLLTIGSTEGLEPDLLPGLRPLGPVDDEGMQALAYSAADLCLVPSLADNQPLVALEALACGVPVIGSAVGGIPEIVRDGETGIRVAPGEPQALAAATARVLDDAQLRSRLGEGARAYAVATHGLDAYADAAAAIYAQVLEESGPAKLSVAAPP